MLLNSGGGHDIKISDLDTQARCGNNRGDDESEEHAVKD
jgi:hypothetical protein